MRHFSDTNSLVQMDYKIETKLKDKWLKTITLIKKYKLMHQKYIERLSLTKLTSSDKIYYQEKIDLTHKILKLYQLKKRILRRKYRKIKQQSGAKNNPKKNKLIGKNIHVHNFLKFRL
jgi:hypothetical protein